MRKVFIFGATGQQGGGVVDGLLSSGSEFQIRTLTRNATTTQAIDLRSKGIEIIEGDFEDDNTLRKVLEGMTSVFLNLDYWALTGPKEVAIGKKIVDICKEAGVQQVVYSSLEPIGRLTGRPCEWFDTKTLIEEYINSKNFPYTVFVKMSSYYENFFTGYTKITQDSTGIWVFSYPIGSQGFTLVPVHDIGRVIAKVICEPAKYNKQSIGLAGDHLTGAELVAIFTEVTGEPAKFTAIPMEDIEAKNPQSATMWRFKLDYENQFKDYVTQSRNIIPDIQNFKTWLQNYWKNKQ